MKAYYLLNPNGTIKRMSVTNFKTAQGCVDIDKLPIQYYNNFSKVVNGNFLLREAEYKEYMSLTSEKKEILKWLADNDWKINKIVIGEWTVNDTRWIEYLNERFVKRQRLDEVSALLEQYEYEV